MLDCDVVLDVGRWILDILGMWCCGVMMGGVALLTFVLSSHCGIRLQLRLLEAGEAENHCG